MFIRPFTGLSVDVILPFFRADEQKQNAPVFAKEVRKAASGLEFRREIILEIAAKDTDYWPIYPTILFYLQDNRLHPPTGFFSGQ